MYDPHKFEFVCEYIRKYGKELASTSNEYINRRHTHFSLIPEVVESFALCCNGHLYVIREGNRVVLNSLGGISVLEQVREIKDALTNKVWKSDKNPTEEFEHLVEWIYHHWDTIRIIIQ